MSDALAQDVRYSIRALCASPGLAAAAILSLALGVGANTAIFSLIDAVMLRSLPVNHPEELLEVKMGSRFFSNPIWEQLRDRQDVFSGIFAYGRWSFNLANGGETRPVNGHFVSGQYFDTLGLRAALGRTLTPSDDKRGCPGAAVLSYGFWQREYGGQTGVIGKTISIDGHPIEIAGVTEPSFTGVEVGTSADVMVPICAKRIIHGEMANLDTNAVPGATFLYSWLQVVGRLKPGITASQATTRLKTLAPQIYRGTLPRDWTAEDQSDYLKQTFYTQPAANGLSYLRREYHETLLILMAITGLVLLIACANVANLLLARGAVRQREIAIRMALGSSRMRLIRQLLTESLVLSITGTAVGVLFAQWGVRLLVGFLDVSLDLRPDLRVLGFCAGLAILTGLLFGVAPAWRGSQVAPQSAMKAGSRVVVKGSKFGAGRALVMTQVALSVPLVAGAGLMLSTFWRLTSLDPGFEREHILLANVDLRNGHYAPQQRTAVFREMLEKLRAIPGVRAASASIITPICHCAYIDEIVIDGYAAKSRDDSTIHLNRVSDRYFETLGITILAGRDFDSHDTTTSVRVALINQTMARKYFGAANPIGKRYRVRQANQLGDPVEIVGVVTDAKYASLREAVPPTAYLPLSQDPARAPLLNFELRAAGGAPTALIASATSAIGAVNRNVSLEFTTLAETVNHSIEREQLLATLATLFGALALLLAAIGLYGVMSYTVARRRNEIGIRMALGAEPGRVLRMVLGEVAALIGAGVVIGLFVAVASTRFVAAFLYGLSPNDPLTISVAAGVLVGVALFAGYWPARRASRLDPMAALREE